MKQETADNSTVDQDKPLLLSFVHELNTSRRQLLLYPPEHPVIVTSVNLTMDILNNLFLTDPVITFGIAPDTIYYEQLWLDKEDPANREFAVFFSGLGIASISFRQGLQTRELIRFNQLLRPAQRESAAFKGFDKLLKQQQIEHISVIPIDYEAFQTNRELTGEENQLWENFLQGLHSGVISFSDLDSTLDLGAIADIFNQKLVGSQAERDQAALAIDLFFENSVPSETGSQSPPDDDEKLAALLEHLSPGAQQEFLSSTFQALDRYRDAAPAMLKKIPSQLLQKMIVGKDEQNLKVSSRLFGLINSLAGTLGQTVQHNVKTESAPASEDMVRARLDVLFSEEKQEQYIPDSYQTALHSILTDDINGTIPDDEKQKLKNQIETESVEQNFIDILLELLQQPLTPEQEKAIHQNLFELSRYFLDIGDFVKLLDIFNSWSEYLYSGNATASILEEKVLSTHTQPTFMAEVLDSMDLWGEEKYQEITDYVIAVGEPYSELVIEYLGLAQEWPERRLWMEILEGIGGDAQQMIVQSLDDERWYLVRNLLIILGKYLDPKTIKVIHQFIDYPHPMVRLEVIRNLFSCNPATANRHLLKDLTGQDPEALAAAVQIADLSHDPTVLTILHKNLSTPMENDTDLEFKKQIVQTLTRIGNNESLPILRRILQQQGLLVSRRVKELQVEILKNLALFPGTSAEKLLQELANGKYKQLVKLAMEQRRKNSRRDR
ncbi:MAG: HEAT repeat domain-containing protein [Desulfuromusa sp.]|nr:HEAT repeat domain-containing protein [Desulfuromusa sp.]